MKNFTIGKRYGLVPYEQTHYRYFPKDRWEAIRRVGVFVIGSGGGIKIEPAGKIYENVDPFYINADYICEWGEPASLTESDLYRLIGRGCGKTRTARRLLNDLYSMNGGHTLNTDFVKYCKEEKMTYEYGKRYFKYYEIKDVKFNGPATIVFWGDGTKTIVKAQNGEPNDPEKAIAMCIAKHFLGTNKTGSNYYDNIKKWLPKEEKK